MKVYKGTDKDMKCYGGFQYELGKTVEDDGAIRCGGKGFHACEAPFDVLRYFPLNRKNRYFVVEVDGEISRDDDDDTKLAASKLTLTAELTWDQLKSAQAAYTREKVEGEGGGDNSNLAGGDRSNLAGGDHSNLAGGDDSNLTGGASSLLACRNGRVKGGLHSVIVLTAWKWEKKTWIPIDVKAEVVDGKRIKADTWYRLEDGKFVEDTNHE